MIAPLFILSAAIAAKPPITAMAFAPDGRSIVTGSQAGLVVRTWPELVQQRSLATSLSHINDLRFSPNGQRLAVVGGKPGERGTVEVFDWPGGNRTHKLDLAKEIVNALAWRAGGKDLSAAGGDGMVYVDLLDHPQFAKVFTGHSRGVQAVVYMPGDKQLLTAGLDDTLRLWNVETGTTIQTLAQHTKAVHGVALRPGAGEPVVASIGADKTVRIWQPVRGRMVRFARLTSVPNAVAWTSDGKAIVTACHDGRVRVVDPESAEVTAELPAIAGVAHCLAVVADGSVAIGGEGGLVVRVKVN